ncbi:wd repeat protein [Stylonychia lemnae]|uniref:Wd repeat protein n=1 Tax=Stylonychia lemnae TaxID=5949 RepID=A0A078APV0_STYLE|nr:wd repeat protein [Stylonychia lemnae]|eukprot:CDW82968.1 wd repeat protein [Stylonychia lemnae]
MVEQAPGKDSQSQSSVFRIKPPPKSSGNTNLQEIVHEFTDNQYHGQGVETLCVRFDEQDKYIGASYTNGTLRVFNSITGKSSLTFVNNFASEEQKAPINMFRFKPAGINGQSHGAPAHSRDMIVCVTTDGRIQYWHIPTNKCVNQILPPEEDLHQQTQDYYDENGLPKKKKSTNPLLQNSTNIDTTLNCLDFNLTSEKLAVAGNDSKVKIYNEHSPDKELLMTLKPTGRNFPGHTNRVYALKFSNTEENILYSSGWDDTVQINDLREGGSVGIISGTHVCGDAIDVCENLLVAGNYRNQKNLMLFDLRKTNKVLQFIEFDNYSTAQSGYFSECLLYGAQFYRQMSQSGIKLIATAATGGRNEYY